MSEDVCSAAYFAQVQATEGWRAILDSFARFVGPSPSYRTLDLGCGPGALVSIFQADYQARAFGVDMDWGMAQAALQMYGPQTGSVYAVGSLPFLPYAPASFDLITATNVIYLVDDPAAALREAARLLKPGGDFVMLNPSEHMSIAAATTLADEKGLSGFARDNFIHWGEVAEAQYRWSEADIQGLFGQAGLKLTETRTRVGPGLARYARGQKV